MCWKYSATGVFKQLISYLTGAINSQAICIHIGYDNNDLVLITAL